MHIPESTLRANLDGELPADESLAVERHLKDCARCRDRSAELAERAGAVRSLFSDLGGGAQPNVSAAWTRTQARASEQPARRSWRASLPGRMVPAWSVVAALSLVVVFASSGSARAYAQKFLSFLRVKQVVAVPVDHRPEMDTRKGKLISEFLASNVNVVKQEKARTVATREEASELAGFAVRLPAVLTDAPQLVVEGAHEFNFTVDIKRAQTLVNLLGRPDLTLPANLEGARFAIDAPRGVVARYGNCPQRPAPHMEQRGDCIMVMQVPAPTVVTVPEVNIAEIAEIGLQLTGMAPEQARAFSRTVDWSSTLAVPVPAGVATHENVTVDGVQGILMTGKINAGDRTRYGLVWVKNGVIYNVGGWGNPSMAIPVAQSLQ
jgi:hypothetical protein